MPKRVVIRKSKIPTLLAAIGRYQRSLVRYRSHEAVRDEALARVLRTDWRSAGAVDHLHRAQIRLRKAWVDLEARKAALLRVVEPPAPRRAPGRGFAATLAAPAPLLPARALAAPLLPGGGGQSPSGQISPSVMANPGQPFDPLANPLLADLADEMMPEFDPEFDPEPGDSGGGAPAGDPL